jgi:DinB superfamily
MARPPTALRELVALLDEAFNRKAWHGTTLLGSLRGLTGVAAAWRPAPGRHNIWELTVHAEYWKYAVRRRLADDARGSFRLKGSNFFARPAPGTTFQNDVRKLVDEHKRLRAAVEAVPPARLGTRFPGRKESVDFVIRGIAAHDLYHAGQIQLIKRLQGGRGE